MNDGFVNFRIGAGLGYTLAPAHLLQLSYVIGGRSGYINAW